MDFHSAILPYSRNISFLLENIFCLPLISGVLTYIFFEKYIAISQASLSRAAKG